MATQEQLLTGIVVSAGMDRVRHMLKFAPEVEEPAYVTAYPDTEGRWWVVRALACSDKAEAERIVGRQLEDPEPTQGDGDE